MAVDSRGEILAYASTTTFVCLTLADGKLACRIDAPGWKSVLVCPPMDSICIRVPTMKALFLWDWHDGKDWLRFGGYDGVVRSVAISPDAMTVASGDSGGNVQLWNTHSGIPTLHFQTTKPIVAQLQWSAGGRQLAAFCTESGPSGFSEVRIWSIHW